MRLALWFAALETPFLPVARRADSELPVYLEDPNISGLLLACLEKKGLIGRYRSEEDERVLLVELTEEGLALRERALKIPYQLKARLNLDHEEAYQLYQMLGRLLQENPME